VILPVAVIDANVVVSGLLTADPTAPTAAILDAMLAGRIRFVLSVELLVEYRCVLLRPKVARRHGLAAADIEVILERIAENAIVREAAPASTAAPDPGDQHLWDLLDIVPAAILVTGDDLLLSAPPTDRSVLSPRAFLSGWQNSPPPPPPTKF
jgi:putative PIN family toxin of toxin-antitoxin system